MKREEVGWVGWKERSKEGRIREGSKKRTNERTKAI